MASATPLLRSEDWREFLDGFEWFLHPEVRSKADEKEAQDEKVTAFSFAGPAIDEIRYVAAVQWIFAMVFPFLVCVYMACPSHNEPFANYPRWVWILFVPVLTYSLKCEVKALRYVLLTLAQYCHPFYILIWKVKRVNKWLLWIGVMSLVTHGDLVTNGLFLAKILKTVALCENERAQSIERMWNDVIGKSILVSWVPGFERIDKLLLLVWGLMFLQPLLCLLYAWPCERAVDYKAESQREGYRTCWSQTCFTSLRDSDGSYVLHHADVLQWLATANRMVSLTDKNLVWTIRRAGEVLDNQQSSVQQNCVRVFDIMSREYARLTHRLLLVNVLEKAYMLEIQATIFAISHYMSCQMDVQMLISLVLSFVTFTKVLYDTFHQLKTMVLFGWKAEQVLQGGRSLIDDNSKTKIHRFKARIYLTCLGFSFGIVALLLLLLHSAAKFIMAFRCQDSLWNIPFWWVRPEGFDWRGCMDLSKYASSRADTCIQPAELLG